MFVIVDAGVALEQQQQSAEVSQGIVNTNVSGDNDSLTATDSYARAVILQTRSTE